MSEARNTPAANPIASPTVLAHSGEVAHWAVMLLGWLWLGEQGMRLGWSLASGVPAVALWWAVRIVCRGRSWTRQSSPLRMGLLGLLTAWGVWLPVWMPDTATAHAALLALAVVWGVWGAQIETRSQTSTFRLSPLAWHPLLAAALVALVWALSDHTLGTPVGASVLLAVSAAVLHARERQSAGRAIPCKAIAVAHSQLLAPSAMGLMMGALWLGDAWCAGLGWSPEHMVWAHLGLMAGLPAVVALSLRGLPHGAGLAVHHAHIGAALMVLGALMLLGNTALHGLLAMGLPSLTWALHCARHGMAPVAQALGARVWPVWALRWLALLLGPGLLLGVGVASPHWGPVAMQAALAALGGLAALWLALSAWRPPVQYHSWPAASLP
jgi:hypothetical protein